MNSLTWVRFSEFAGTEYFPSFDHFNLNRLPRPHPISPRLIYFGAKRSPEDCRFIGGLSHKEIPPCLLFFSGCQSPPSPSSFSAADYGHKCLRTTSHCHRMLGVNSICVMLLFPSSKPGVTFSLQNRLLFFKAVTFSMHGFQQIMKRLNKRPDFKDWNLFHIYYIIHIILSFYYARVLNTHKLRWRMTIRKNVVQGNQMLVPFEKKSFHGCSWLLFDGVYSFGWITNYYS